MDHHNKIEVPDPLAVEDLISSKLNNKRKLARLITQYRALAARHNYFNVLYIIYDFICFYLFYFFLSFLSRKN